MPKIIDNLLRYLRKFGKRQKDTFTISLELPLGEELSRLIISHESEHYGFPLFMIQESGSVDVIKLDGQEHFASYDEECSEEKIVALMKEHLDFSDSPDCRLLKHLDPIRELSRNGFVSSHIDEKLSSLERPDVSLAILHNYGLKSSPRMASVSWRDAELDSCESVRIDYGRSHTTIFTVRGYGEDERWWIFEDGEWVPSANPNDSRKR